MNRANSRLAPACRTDGCLSHEGGEDDDEGLAAFVGDRQRLASVFERKRPWHDEPRCPGSGRHSSLTDRCMKLSSTADLARRPPTSTVAQREVNRARLAAPIADSGATRIVLGS